MKKFTKDALSELYRVAFDLNVTEDVDGMDCCQLVFDAARNAAKMLYGESIGEWIDSCVIDSGEFSINSLDRFQKEAEAQS